MAPPQKYSRDELIALYSCCSSPLDGKTLSEGKVSDCGIKEIEEEELLIEF